MASPKVNRVPYDFASLELSIEADGEPLSIIDAFTEIEYSDNVEREKYYGSNRVPVDATEGVYDAEGAVTFRRDAFNQIVDWGKQRGKGFYQLEMTLTISYAHKDEPLVKDTIRRVKFGSRENSHSQGPENLVVPCDLFIQDRIFFDGIGPFGETL